MQRGVSAEAREAAPGIFQTIAAAMSLLVVQPVLLAVPLLVDLYLWLGARISPARLVEPVAAVLAARPGLEADALGASLRGMSESGNLIEFVGWFVPSLVGSAGSAGLALPWAKPLLEPASLGQTLLLAAGFVALGGLGLMTLQVMMARVIRDGVALGPGLIRAIGRATLRYAGFLALLIPTLVMAVGAGSLVASLVAVISPALASLAVLALVALIVTAALLLTFVVDAIALAEVGPVRAVELSAGVVRRFPWTSIGLFLVTGVSLITLPELARRLIAESVLGVIGAMLVYTFIATGLALARMQFFADRWRLPRPGQPRRPR